MLTLVKIFFIPDTFMAFAFRGPGIRYIDITGFEPAIEHEVRIGTHQARSCSQTEKRREKNNNPHKPIENITGPSGLA